jgi:hypothetical protein
MRRLLISLRAVACRALFTGAAVLTILSFLGVFALAIALVLTSLNSMVQPAPLGAYLLAWAALAFTGWKTLSYSAAAETFRSDKTCKVFRRGRSRSSTRNAFLTVVVGNYFLAVPQGPLCLYLAGILAMYVAANLSEPGGFWKKFALDWGVKQWLNHADILVVAGVIKGSGALVASTFLIYSAAVVVLIGVNSYRHRVSPLQMTRIAFDRLRRHDLLVGFVLTLLSRR